MANIIIVDSDASRRRALASILAEAGHSILETPGGEEAVAEVRSCRPDLALIAPMKAGMELAVFTESLFGEAGPGKTQVLFYGPKHLEPEVRELSAKSGVRYFTADPPRPQEVLEVVQATLGLSTPAALSSTPRREKAGLTAVRLSRRATEGEPKWSPADSADAGHEGADAYLESMVDVVGRFAAGVAHDFNNVLSVILGNVAVIKGVEGLPPEITDAVRQIVLSAELASNLTQDLLLLGKRRVVHKQNVDLNELLDEIVRNLRETLGSNIILRFDSVNPLPPVNADAALIGQALMTLATFSRNSMPEGGELTITASGPRADEIAAGGNHEPLSEQFIGISISRTGPVIAPDDLPRIFEPYYSKRTPGKNTGFGLATAYAAVRQHGGWMNVTSEPNRGARFALFLPCARGLEDAKRVDTVRAGGRQAHETILLVEDQPLLRSIVGRVLERQGYRVYNASSESEAMVVWAECGGKIELLLTDVIMPDGLTGRELAERLKAQKPGLKVIFTSGFPAEILDQDASLREGVNFFQKPYDLRKLTEAVRSSLDS